MDATILGYRDNLEILVIEEEFDDFRFVGLGLQDGTLGARVDQDELSIDATSRNVACSRAVIHDVDGALVLSLTRVTLPHFMKLHSVEYGE